ncbi:MAG: helix-turn-helix transcriptional regulator [Bacteroidota bacterium]
MRKFFDYKDFGESLKYKMSYGDTLRKLKEETGVPVSAISRVINGKPVKIENLIPLADWMKAKLDDFVKRQPDQS